MIRTLNTALKQQRQSIWAVNNIVRSSVRFAATETAPPAAENPKSEQPQTEQPKDEKPKTDKAYLDKPEGQRQFLDQLAKKLNIQNPSDWYKVKREDFKAHGGERILRHYDSIGRAIATIYPEHNFKQWEFKSLPRNFWDKVENQRAFFDVVGKELGVNKPEDWYKVSIDEFKKRGGTALLAKQFNGSLVEALKVMYPDVKWDSSKFVAPAPKPRVSEFDNIEKQRQEMDRIGKELGVKDLDDWYNVTLTDVRQHGGSPIVNRYAGSLSKTLQAVYPEKQWDLDKLAVRKAKRATQRNLFLVVEEVLREKNPNIDIREDYIHPTLKLESGDNAQFDIFLPEHKVAIEYLGEHHFVEINFFARLAHVRKIDAQKAKLCKDNGITLITIPYTWDRTKESIRATLHKYRPDLVPHPGNGIPVDPMPDKNSERYKHDLKEEVVMIPDEYTEDMDPAGWLMMEKFNGIRAYWDGENLITRNKRELPVPAKFVENFPKVPLDGEIWIGRGRFEELVSLNKSSITPAWEHAKFCVFDLHNEPGTYTERYARLKQLSLPKNVLLVPHARCEGKQHLKDFVAEVEKVGGEGVLLADPNGQYEMGRSSNFLEVRMKDYSEVKVLSQNPKCRGLNCLQPNGQQVVVRCVTPEQYKTAPGAGTIITVEHNGYWKTGKLKFAFFHKARPDLDWATVVKNAAEQAKTAAKQ